MTGGQQQYGAPQYGAPQYGAPAPYGAPHQQYGAPQYGAQVYSSHRYTTGPDSYVPTVAPVVPPGERLLGIVNVDLSDLVRRVPRRYRPERDGALRVLYYLFDIVAVVIELLEEAVFGFFRVMRRIFRGRGLVGGWESQAGRFAIAVLTGPKATRDYENHDTLMVFTDRRILLVHELGKGPEVLGEIPGGQLTRIELRLTAVSGRADAHFADGSRAALEIGEKDAAALEALARGAVPPPSH
ncbi:hypothetical protein [Kitasatospora camelliae]|uniref:Uncharacterized protein n=1 Tax=Kitasatospora camelliae TaxID=3156397 RepID=A0AAU8K0K3_9ACTN